MNDYEDITVKYLSYPRFGWDGAKPEGQELFIGDLIRTADARILIPQIGPEEANLFTVYAAVGSGLEVVREFPTLADAERFLDEAEAQGWRVSRWGDFLPQIKWLAKQDPEAAESLMPWLQSHIPSTDDAG